MIEGLLFSHKQLIANKSAQWTINVIVRSIMNCIPQKWFRRLEDLARSVVSLFLTVLNIFVRKDRRRMCLCTDSFALGNARYFYHHVKDDERFDVITISDRPDSCSDISSIRLRSCRALWHILRSRYVISTHIVFRFVARRQVSVCLWHGIPVKWIQSTKKPPPVRCLDYFTTPSIFADMIYVHQTKMRSAVFVHTGAPVYDYFNTPEAYLGEEQVKQLQTYRDKILYAPTYRSWRGDQEGDDIENILRDVLFAAEEAKECFVISLHPRDTISASLRQRILDSSYAEFSDYPSEMLLPFVKRVVLDITSLYYQSLYLKKNITVYFPDWKKYQTDRNLIFPNLEIIPRSVIVRNVSDLQSAIADNDVPDAYATLRDLFFPRELQNCSDELIELILRS